MRVLLILLLLCSTANAALTPNKVPKTKTGGATPTLQDSTITDDGTNVTASGNITADNHIVSGFGTVPQVYSDVDTNSGLFFSGPDVLEIHTGGLNGLAINSSQNVGVATHSPTSKLHVYNTSAGNSFEVDDQASDTTPFIIDSVGNVGIGTNVTASLLNIKTTTGSGFRFTQSTGNTLFDIDNSGVVSFNGAGGYSTIAGGADLGARLNIGNLSNSSRAVLGLGGSAGFTDSFFEVNSVGDLSGDIFVIEGPGNVGIGTINPVAKLEVTQTAALDAFRVNDQATDTTPFIIDSTGNIGIGTWEPSYSFQIGQSFNVNGGIGFERSTAALSPMAGAIRFGDNTGWKLYFGKARVGGALQTGNSSILMTIQDNGNVGIGTTTPQGAFVVTNGDVGIGTWKPSALQHIVQSSNYNAFRVDDSLGDTTPFVIDSSGRVGINSASPQELLSIFTPASGAVDMINLYQNGGNANDESRINFSTSAGRLDGAIGVQRAGVGTKGLLKLYTGSVGVLTARLAIDPDNGNVGISTTKPTALLDVLNTAAIDSFRVNDQANDTSPFIIDATGNVGIGSVNPIAPLEVNGLVVVDKVTADPCTAGAPAGGIFYNSTSNYMCYCNGTNDVKMSDDTTACF